MSEFWDSVVHLERDEYDRGYNAGLEESLRMNDEAFGYAEGLMKGYAIGFEAGFIAAAAAALMEGANGDVALTERGKKKVEELKIRAVKIPNKNDGETDFDDEVQSIRSKYKQLGSSFGPCPPKLQSVDTKTPPVSHDW